MLGEYPDSPYREEAMMLRFKSAYELAKNSIENLESDRYKEAATAYLEFNDAFPESLFLKEVESVYKKIQAFSEKNRKFAT
jgi:outer membrane protein assembly factor BamD